MIAVGTLGWLVIMIALLVIIPRLSQQQRHKARGWECRLLRRHSGMTQMTTHVVNGVTVRYGPTCPRCGEWL